MNELRTALEEFLYLSRRREKHSVVVKVSNCRYPMIKKILVNLDHKQEIVITEPELELVRNANEVKFSAPIRMCHMHWSKK